MICNEIRRLAYFYLDGTVGREKTALMESHFERCPECGTRLTIHRRLREAIRIHFGPVHAPQRLRERVQQACRGCE
jgi:anti-sigma factor (TIGR02949 family)